MLSGSFGNITHQVEQMKAVAALIIDDKVLNSHGRYDETYVANEPIKSFCRTMWNMWSHIERFQSRMNDKSFPTLLKAGLLILKLDRIYTKFSYEFVCHYVKQATIPTLKNLNQIKSNFTYVHVINKKHEGIYYVDKKKNIIEKLEMDPVFLVDIFETPYIKEAKFDVYWQMSNKILVRMFDVLNSMVDGKPKHGCPLYPETSDESLTLYLAAINCLNEIYDSETEKYNVKVLAPIVEEFRQALPIDWILGLLKKVFVDLPNDFTIDEYMNVENEGFKEVIENVDGVNIKRWDGHPSLNQHADIMLSQLESMVEKCKENVKVTSSSSSSSSVVAKEADKMEVKRQEEVEAWVKWVEDYLEARQKNNNYKVADFFKGQDSDGVKRKNYLENVLKPAFEKYIKNGDITPILEALEKGREFKSHQSKNSTAKKIKSLQDILQDIKDALDVKNKNVFKH